MLPTTKTILLSSSISNILPKGCTVCLIPCPQRSCEVAVPPTQNVFSVALRLAGSFISFIS